MTTAILYTLSEFKALVEAVTEDQWEEFIAGSGFNYWLVDDIGAKVKSIVGINKYRDKPFVSMPHAVGIYLDSKEARYRIIAEPVGITDGACCSTVYTENKAITLTDGSYTLARISGRINELPPGTYLQLKLIDELIDRRYNYFTKVPDDSNIILAQLLLALRGNAPKWIKFNSLEVVVVKHEVIDSIKA